MKTVAADVGVPESGMDSPFPVVDVVPGLLLAVNKELPPGVWVTSVELCGRNGGPLSLRAAYRNEEKEGSVEVSVTLATEYEDAVDYLVDAISDEENLMVLPEFREPTPEELADKSDD